MDPTTDMLLRLGQYGILGVLLALSILWNVRLQSSLKELQEKRTCDAQAIIDKLLVLSTQWATAITKIEAAIGALDKEMDRVQNTLLSRSGEWRALPPGQGGDR